MRIRSLRYLRNILACGVSMIVIYASVKLTRKERETMFKNFNEEATAIVASEPLNSRSEATSTRNKAGNRCPAEHFRVAGMKECHKWLDCEEIDEMSLNLKRCKKLGIGFSKKVYRVPWKNNSIYFAMSVLAPITRVLGEEETKARFRMGRDNLLKFQSNRYVTQVVGHCEKDENIKFLTEESSKYGSLDKFVLSQQILQFNALQRLLIVIQLIDCFVYLHYKSGPPKVHCDLHNPLQALRQFLLKDNRKVVLVDLDELPEDDPKNNKTAKCKSEVRCNMSNSSFLAPEQRYTRKECLKEKHFKKRATVKSDIWKIPDISREILNETFANDTLNREISMINVKLQTIHAACKQENVSKRVNSLTLFREYKKVYKEVEKFYENNRSIG